MSDESVINPAIQTKDRSFYLKGKPFFIYSGEIHYFRIPKKYWNSHLQQAKSAGLNTVSSYIPWNWHEYEEGKFDFTGQSNPQRDLVQFLKLIKKNGLYFSARVGPVSNAELTHEGIPGWLLDSHPEIYVQRKGFNNLPHALLLSYLHPTFQNYVKKWYDQILPLVSQSQVHQGGPILLVQLCNEIGMIHWLHKAFDESEFVTTLYQNFLEEKYGEISQLNQRYGAHYQNYSQVRQPQGDLNPENFLIHFDWALFYRRYYALYFHSLSRQAKEHAITVPLSANAPQFYDYDVRGRGVFSPMTTSLYQDFSRLNPGTVFGGAYQMRRLDFENFHDIVITSEVTKLLDDAAPTICAELQTGVMRDRPRLYPQDVDLNIKTSVAHGLNGVNCYMFSSGLNSKGMGAFGSYHDWQAPVSLNGKETKPHIQPLKEWGKWIQRHGSDLAETKKVSDFALGFYSPYYATEYCSGAWVQELESARTNFFFDGFARIVQLAGFNYSFRDLLKSSLQDLLQEEMVSVFSLERMDEETQSKLLDYCRKGGKLLLGPRVPLVNLRNQKCTLLADGLGVEVEPIQKKEIILWKGMECPFDAPI
ncbi:MAG: beta-galactosidase, partial [Elusimicrobia bacterium]|nr:beta-galactosidase [Elusimicrobiota bacterium]